MTQNNPPAPLELILDPRDYGLMQEISKQAFGKDIHVLDHGEASRLVGGFMMSITQNRSGEVARKGQVVVNSIADGQEAFAGYGRQWTRELDPQADNGRDIILKVARDRTRWEAIRNRKPKIVQTYHYRDEPPQSV